MLAKIQHQLEFGSGATLIQGFPAERFSEAQIERIFWGLTTYIGTAVSQSAKGDRIFHVRDEGFRVGQPQARGPNTVNALVSIRIGVTSLALCACNKPSLVV